MARIRPVKVRISDSPTINPTCANYSGVNLVKRFDSNRYYRTHDPALTLIATSGTLAQWRHHGKGPAYIRFGNRVLYLGATLNEWLDAHVVRPGTPDDSDDAPGIPR